MHEVKRAIIMAAGIGKRMSPLTAVTPKPLIEVNGVRMIDSVIQSLRENDIWDIYVVVGYLKEKFQVLQEQYKGIQLIENPYYERCNNISSLYMAREYLGECVILDADQMIYHPEILNRTFHKSCYCCKWTDDETKEWLLELEGDRVSGCRRDGGRRGWQLYSVSFWTMADGGKLRHYLEREFEEKKNDQIYWDDVALFCYPDDFDLGIREVKDGDIVEIDDLSELVQIDSRYINVYDRAPERG